MDKLYSKKATLQIFLLFLIFISFPLDILMPCQKYLQIIFGAFLRLIFIIILVKKVKCSKNKIFRRHLIQKDVLFLIPYVLVVFNNLISLRFIPNFKYSIITPIDWTITITLFFIVVSEELLFRGYLMNLPSLKGFGVKKVLKRIIISSFIFAIFHFTSFINMSINFTLVQIGYTFLLGLVLGLIYEYTGNIFAPIIFHYLYNFFNQVIYLSFYNEYWTDGMKIFTIANIVIMIIYSIVLFLISIRNGKIGKE